MTKKKNLMVIPEELQGKTFDPVVDPLTGEVVDWRPRIRTQLREMVVPFADKPKESSVVPSATVPGMSMTIAEMVARHRKGLPIDQSVNPQFLGDELIPDISQMDLVDRQAYVDSVADALYEVRSRIDANAKSEKEKEFVSKVNAAVALELSKLALPDKPTAGDVR